MSTKSSDPLQYLINAVSVSAKMNIPALETGYFPRDNTNSVVCFKGKAAVVFAFQLQKQLKAIKIWPKHANEYMRQRYAITENYFSKTGLGYFVSTFYLQNAINIDGVYHDALLMDWVKRQNIKEYIHANISEKEKMEEVAEQVLFMHKALNNAGVAHGHLHAGNIYVDAQNKLKLIGCDAVFIDGESANDEVSESYPDYSHPSAKQKGVKADYFAALTIYLSVKALALDSVLWGRYKVGFHEGLIFKAEDFKNIENAVIYKHLRKLQSPEIDKLLDILVIYCGAADTASLIPFYNYLKNDLLLDTGSIAAAHPDAHNSVVVIPSGAVNESKQIDIIKNNLVAEVNDEQVVKIHVSKPVHLNSAFATISLAKPTVQQPFNTYTETAEGGLDVVPAAVQMPVANKFTPKKVNNIKIQKATAVSQRKRRYVVAGTIIGFIALTSGYFFGRQLAHKMDEKSLNMQRQTNSSQEEPVLKTLVTQQIKKDAGKQSIVLFANSKDTVEKIVVKNIMHDSAAINNAVVSIEKYKENDSLPAVNPTARALVTNNPVVSTSNKTIEDSLSAITYYNTGKKLIARKTATEKQQADAFKIGAPPKEKK